ncbi:MAG TPA: hypothetical protein VFJ43_06785 [Bacteroidia bacterium]|nr:hypothetical protein [Bacteroidia bacterium]
MKKLLPFVLICASVAFTGTVSMAADGGKTEKSLVRSGQNDEVFTASLNEIVIAASPYEITHYAHAEILNASVPFGIVKFADVPLEQVFAEQKSKPFRYPLAIGRPDTKRHCEYLADIIKLC